MLLCFMGCADLVMVKTPQKSVNVTTGGTVALQCTFTTTAATDKLNIQWTFEPKTTTVPQQVYYYLSGQADVQGSFQGRIKEPMFPNVTKNASIAISNMKPSDSGIYTCEVHNFPDTEGKTEGNIIVNVLERPSTPYCAVHGTVESGHLVSLTCHTEKGNPPPTYTWTKLDQGKARSARGDADIQSGTMYIRNLSQFQFGEYQCNASNVVGFSTCTLELLEELGDGAIAGAVIGSVLGCGLVVFLVWFISHRLKKRKNKTVGSAAEPEAAPASSDSVKYSSLPTREGATQASVKPTPPSQDPAHGQGGDAEA